MARFDFNGGTYQASAVTASAERAINTFPETVESPAGKSKLTMRDVPGMEKFASLGATAVLGIFACQPNGSLIDRVFAVVESGEAQALWEVFQDGTKTNRGALTAPTSQQVTFAQNQTQLAICTGGQVWVFTFATNALTGPVSVNGNTISLIDACDQFGIAINQNSNLYQVSTAGDFTSWPGLAVGANELPDNVISLKVLQKTVWFMGRKGIVPYYDFGYFPNPLGAVPGVVIENGAAGTFARAVVDNTFFFWDQNERGGGICRRMNGYTPQRVSNHAIENMVAQYPTIADAISWAEEWQGHPFLVTYFPSGIGADGQKGAGATLVYDVSTGLWHERAYQNVKGYLEAAHMRGHCYAWGKHLVGDWATGNIYELNFAQLNKTGTWDFADNDGSPLRRIRRGPHISAEDQWVTHNQFVLAAETGLGPQPPLTGPYSGVGIQNSIIIPDQNGAAFELQISDEGDILAAPSQGSVQTVILADSVTPSTAWQVTYDSVNDKLAPIAAAFASGYSQAFPLATMGNQLQSGLFVSGGLLQVMAPAPAPRGPQVTLRFSNDGGRTWVQTSPRDLGQAGQYRVRTFWQRLGRARTRTYEIEYSDPAPLRIVDAYLDADPDYKPTQRTMQRLEQNA